MKVEIYKSYGVLAHEKKPVYTVSSPASDIYDKVLVEIPNISGENMMGDLLVKLETGEFPLNQVLGNYDEDPALIWFDGFHTRHKILEVVG